jgi:hypothetical protein
MSAFIQYWDTAEWRRQQSRDGRALDYISGDGFNASGIKLGEYLYVVCVEDGQFFLLGRMIVDYILSPDEAKSIRGEAIGTGQEHLLSESQTPMRFNRVVAEQVVMKLRFDDDRTPPSDPPERVDVYDPARPLRRISRESAILLDHIIDEVE